LPSAPKTFQDMVACLQQPGVAVSDVAQIVARDVSMTANIMKLVNSAFFGARQTISNVDRAVKYLGLDTLGALVLGHGVFRRPATIAIEGFSVDYLWQHSMRTASGARAIALHEKLGAAKAEQAFMTGLLHDVGRIVFAARASGATEPVLSSEERLAQMDMHHAEVGAYLLGLWGFPSSVVEAVAYHHNTSGTTESGFGLTVLIHIANRLAQRTDGAGLDPAELGIEAGLLERLGLLTHLPEWAALMNDLNDEESSA
jgi:putative nucleotidyltransferase with HDIG domain